MADLDLLIAQLAAADEITEGLGVAQPALVQELQAAIRDATVCAYRLRLARNLNGGLASVVEQG